MVRRPKNNPRQVAAARIIAAVMAGLAALRVDPPVRMSTWSRKNFYLSRESSQTEGGWNPWPYQVAVMDAISDDDIFEVDVKKSARWGYTKILVCGLLYFAQHKKRNQIVWQPTDDDRDEFVKVELDPVLRDVPCMRPIFPAAMKKSKGNTLEFKQFLTAVIHAKGGTSAGNYRRITVSVGFFDELAAFPLDVDGEGRPFNLGAKRVEGAVFGKIVAGSTPKVKGHCQIDERVQHADQVFSYHIPCPHCGHEHELDWAGKGATKYPRGLVWFDDDPETVGHLCPACGALYRQKDYLAVTARGRWINPNTGIWIDVNPDGDSLLFRNPAGEIVRKPRHIAFRGWSAYSPQVTWESIVKEFIAARKADAAGDNSLLKTFYNITAGECWEEEIEKGDAQELIRRAEPYPLRVVPRDALILIGFCDVQGDRFEWVVWGFGRGYEMWVIDYRRIEGINPYVDDDWSVLDAHIDRRYPHARGGTIGISVVGIDSGFATHQTYRFVRPRQRKGVHATKGDPVNNLDIKGRVTLKDVKYKSGKVRKNGVKLHFIGTDAAKDTIFGRLQVETPGPGYVHFSTHLPPVFYEQLVSEHRVTKKTGGDYVHRWEKPTPATRNEVLDCTVGCLWGLELAMERYRNPEVFWSEMEGRLSKLDLFAFLEEPEPEPITIQASPEPEAEPEPNEAPPPPAPKPVQRPARAIKIPPKQQHKAGLGREDWVL